MQPASTIYIQLDLKEKLHLLKRDPSESYNDVLERLLAGTADTATRNGEAIVLDIIRPGQFFPSPARSGRELHRQAD